MNILIRDRLGALFAYNAACPHAGCPVGYISGLIMCGCHGSVFDPASGKVIQGPASSNLTSIKLEVEDGQIYATGFVGNVEPA